MSQYIHFGPQPPKPDWGKSMAYFYSAHNFVNGENFGFYGISLKVSQTELQNSRKSDTVLTQYADS